MAKVDVLTNAGLAIVSNRIKGSGTEPKYLAWGTGAGTAAAVDTTLFSESAEESRTTGTSSRTTTYVANDTYQVTGRITCATSGKSITNAGAFDAATAGNLCQHSSFDAYAVAVAEYIDFVFKLICQES